MIDTCKRCQAFEDYVRKYPDLSCISFFQHWRETQAFAQKDLTLTVTGNLGCGLSQFINKRCPPKLGVTVEIPVNGKEFQHLLENGSLTGIVWSVAPAKTIRTFYDH